MKRSSIITGAVLALSLTACQKELQGPEEQRDHAFAITATRESGADDAAADTKATINNAKLSWSAGESIGIYDGATSGFVGVKTLEGGETATFYSDNKITPSNYAVYPTLSAKVESASLKVTLPDKYENYTSGAAYPAMLATFSGTPSSLYFKHLGGLVKFNVTNLPKRITKFVFTTTNNMTITGEFTVGDDGGNKVIKSVATDGTEAKTVTFTFSNTAESNDMVFYIPLPVLASDAQYEFQYDFQTADGVSIYTTTKTGWVKIVRGKYFTFNIGFNGTQGGAESGVTSVTLSSDVTDYALPSTDGTVNVTMEGNANNVTLHYTSEGVAPAYVNILCEGNIGKADDTSPTGLTVNLPKSHVEIKKADGVSSDVTINVLKSITSNSTLVLDKSISEVKTLTVEAGSAEIASPKVETVTVANTVDDDATVKVTDAAAKVTSLTVSKGNVEIAAGTVTNVTVASTVAETATVKVAEGATVTDKLDVAKAASVEVAGEVKAISVAAEVAETKVASTATGVETVDVKGGSVEVAATVKTSVTVAASVSNVTIAAAVPTVTVAAATNGEESNAAPVIWVAESGSITTTLANNNANTTVVAATTTSGSGGATTTTQINAISGTASSSTKVKSAADYLVDGGEVTLGEDMTGKFTIASDKEVTIDLNGHKITNKDAANTFTVALGGKLTIKGNGTVDNTANRCAAIHNNGTLVLNGGTYTRSAEDGTTANSYYTILNHGDMTVNSGVKVENGGTHSSTIASGYDTWKADGATKYTYVSGTNVQNPTLTINGGTITGGKYNVKNGTDGKLTVAAGVELAKVKDNGVFVAYVASEATLSDAIKDATISKIVLTKDITLENIAKIDNAREVVIDMNNHSVKRYKTPFVISHAKVEFTGTGTISETEDRKDDWALAPIRVEGATTDQENYSVVTVGRDITLKGWSGIMVGTDEGGEKSYNNYGIVVNFHGKIARPDGFSTDEYGIYINGQNKNTTGNVPVFNLDGATIDVACAGIYAAGYAKWNIKNSTLTGAKETAVEIRAGEMTIESGTFTSSAKPFSTEANGNGTTVKGAALAISQHTTDLDINVNVKGGTFKGVYALYEDDLQNNTGNVTVSVASGATLTGKVYSKHYPALNTPEEVKDEAALNAALANEKVNKIKLIDNIALTSTIKVSRELTLDLNSKTISPASAWSGSDALVVVKRGGNLTIIGNGTVDAKGNENVYAAVKLTESGEDDATNAAKLTIENGTFRGYYYAISGNGTRHNTELNINGGTFEVNNNAEGTAVFLPQQGTTIINGGDFTAVNSAIEIRAGKLKITDGTFTATAATYSVTSNKSGTTVVGAALAISQHTTRLPIRVMVAGGTFSGNHSVCSVNPEGNDDAANVQYCIYGSAKLTGTSETKYGTLYYGSF